MLNTLYSSAVNKLTAENFAPRLKQSNLLIKTDFYNNLTIFRSPKETILCNSKRS